MNPPLLRLNLLGPPTVVHDGVAMALPFERRNQLVALLALRRGWVPRAEVAAMLWPEQESKLAYTNLRKALFRMGTMPWAAGLESQTAALRFEPDTDVRAVEHALRAQDHDAVLAAYAGDLLTGFDDGQSEPWTRFVSFERERLRGAWRAAALARLADERAEPSAALPLIARLLDADPLDESAMAHQLAWLQRDGQTAAARAAYRVFAERLQRELGIEPGAELRSLHESLGSSPSRPPAAGAAPAAAPNDSFVGRGIELRRIGDLLARDECRLLCLVGPGGVGKTRLARRALQDLASRFEQGALFVAFEDVTQASRFGACLASALGVKRGALDPLQAVCAAIKSDRRLIVLDNLEQLAEDIAPQIEALLKAVPGLKLLVTSRVRLALAAEWSMPVEGLPVPDPEDEDRAEAFDAVRLFVKAAQRVQPSFNAAGEAAAIVDICRQVEGLPLAIELAAAWVRVLSCREIAAELRGGLELLRARDASHPARHSSIELVFDESWRRLAASERSVLARLALFQGGFTVEAARAVAGAALPILGSLADKSLLRREGARLQLHPLVQQLAHARLTQDESSLAQTQAAHTRWFLDQLVTLHPRADSGDGHALDAIDADFDNLRRAWTLAIAGRQAGALQRAVPALASHCEHRARFDDGLSMLRAAAESAQEATALQSHALAYAALCEYRLARYDEALVTATDAHALARRARCAPAELQALKVQASCANATGRYADARRLFTDALVLGRELGHNVAQTLENLSLVEKRMGHYERALDLALEALGVYRRDRNHAALAMGLTNLASMRMFMDETEEAAEHLREALALCEREGLTSTRAYALANFTELALKTQDWEAARVHAERALALAEANGIALLQGWLRVQVARLAARRDDLPAARAELAQAARQALSIGAPGVKAAALQAFAELAAQQGHERAARRVLAFGADEVSLSMADRDELRVDWARRAAGAEPDPPWPGIGLDALLARMAEESGAAYAPLLAEIG